MTEIKKRHKKELCLKPQHLQIAQTATRTTTTKFSRTLLTAKCNRGIQSQSKIPLKQIFIGSVKPWIGQHA